MSILRAFDCVDCGENTHVGNEYYMVHDHLWSMANMKPGGGMLCIGCLEKRIGRRLFPSDFPLFPVNISNQFTRSDRLKRRLGMKEVV